MPNKMQIDQGISIIFGTLVDSVQEIVDRQLRSNQVFFLIFFFQFKNGINVYRQNTMAMNTSLN